MKPIHLLLCTLALAAATQAQVIHIPADYPTIQQGIDTANAGDTVLVSPGTYYENINYNGKNITVASLFLVTQDPAYISQTIIDGNNAGSVVTFSGTDNTALLSGFTLTNGSAYNYGGGINCTDSSPRIENAVIANNSCHAYIGWGVVQGAGGGIYCSGSNPVIKNVRLKENEASGSLGGGIYFQGCSPVLENIVIESNYACRLPGQWGSYVGGSGGGMYAESSSLVMKNVTLSDNAAHSGGGICLAGSSVIFDYTDRCDIYANSAYEGNDLYSDIPVEVVVDTFSVLNPGSIHVAPDSNFTFDILHELHDQAAADIFVSPSGNNRNSGLSAGNPVKTIGCALSFILADSLGPRIIHLQEGIYSPSNNQNIFPIALPDYISLAGDSEMDVILNAEGSDRVIELSGNTSSHISGMTISGGRVYGSHGGGIYCMNSDPFIENVILTGNSAAKAIDGYNSWGGKGGGIYLENSNPSLLNVQITNNASDAVGGGIYCISSSPFLSQLIIDSNTGTASGGGLSLEYSDPVLQKVTISNNSTGQDGGGIFSINSNPVFQDVRIMNNSALMGGGIYIQGSSLENIAISGNTAQIGGGIYICGSTFLKNVTVSNNMAHSKGGGIYGTATFDSIYRCNIYLNRAVEGKDLYTYYFQEVIVAVDTFTVLVPSEIHAAPFEYFSFDILHGYHEQINADVYVSPEGDDNNSGLTGEDPLKTIDAAMTFIVADSLYPNTIRLMAGTYSPSSTGEHFPVGVPDFINIEGMGEDQVVLDGEGALSVMEISNNSTQVISGMKITGGSGYGIHCTGSVTELKDITLINNTGNGIYCGSSGFTLEDVDITNTAGTGISCESSVLVMEDVTVSHNAGTGIYSRGSDLTFKGGTISYNDGRGMECYDSTFVMFDDTDRCNIFLNNVNTAYGRDLYSDIFMEAVLDTFTVKYPNSFYAQPLQNFSFDILNGKNPQTYADLYVSPDGDDSNSGLTPDDPMKTIGHAASWIAGDALQPHTIYMKAGTYSSSATGETFPVSLADYCNLAGESASSVTLDAEGQSSVIWLNNNISCMVSSMSITGGWAGIHCEYSNPIVVNTLIYDNGTGLECYYSSPVVRRSTISGSNSGRGIYLHESNPLVEYVKIENNIAGGIYSYNSRPVLDHATINGNSGAGINGESSMIELQNSSIAGNTSSAKGGGIRSYMCSITLKNVIITENVTALTGGGIYSEYSDVISRNVTISKNRAISGGAILSKDSQVHLTNTIMWDDSAAQELCLIRYDYLDINWSDIEGGEAGIHNFSGSVNWQEGNLNLDPLFTGTGEHPYSLSPDSPCRNAGTPDTTGLSLPLTDLAGGLRVWEDRVDMGAYEWSNVGIPTVVSPQSSVLSFPNPTNGIFNVQFTVYYLQRVSLKIYDVQGREVAVVLDAKLPAGEHIVSYDASGLPAGIYLYRLTTDDRRLTTTGKLVKY